jgi:hypothetical protein
MSGLGLRRGDSLQVFAPNQNENLYTNNWTGPYYGYQRVIETFEVTERPRRLKPINIYYHTYSASKQASLAALHRVYRWALAQPTVPVFASDYIGKVHDFHHLAIARDWRSDTPVWRVRGDGELRTLRVGSTQAVDLEGSRSVAGVAAGRGGRYLHLTDAAAEVRLPATAVAAPVHVQQARGWLRQFRRSAEGISFALHSYTQPGFTLAEARGCHVRVDGRELASVQTDSSTSSYELPPGEVSTASTISRVDVVCR